MITQLLFNFSCPQLTKSQLVRNTKNCNYLWPPLLIINSKPTTNPVTMKSNFHKVYPLHCGVKCRLLCFLYAVKCQHLGQVSKALQALNEEKLKTVTVHRTS